ncbi:hypothetical protein QJS65_11135 [Bacillus altitudinis]|uniref:hypothetical protein n=1 Tax=Bacillus altitudinis TaxID=293387 RepID=UPI0024A86858|nr:hypothetical protein [Bacillus altitudinis]WHF25399.1 hypothetical protein QJS65_11135 [Bacillus altitudinis]
MTEYIHNEFSANDFIKSSYIRVRKFIEKTLESLEIDEAESVSKFSKGGYNITVYSRNKPSNEALVQTNQVVNQLMNNLSID